MNGSGETNGHVTPDNTEIIRISGRKEDCEAAAQALKALVPINIEVNYLFSIPSTKHCADNYCFNNCGIVFVFRKL